MSDLTGKVALVTGGSTDIGGAICIALAEAGADVVVNYCTNQAGAEFFKEEVERLGCRSMVFQADVTDITSTQAMMNSTVQQLGSLDILVNGVGAVAPKKPFFEWTEIDWSEIVDATLKGTFFCTQQATAHMVHRNWGRVINVSTTATYLANDFRAPYIAAKGGVEALSRALAIELAPHGITVNVVAPPVVAVKRNRSRWEFYEEKLVPFIPMGRMALPRDIGSAVALFASTQADFITGQILRVDGGWTSRPAYPVE